MLSAWSGARQDTDLIFTLKQRSTVVLFLSQEDWAILHVSPCGFTTRKLMQLKTNLYFLLDEVPDHKGTKTPVSTPWECKTTLSDHSLLGNHSQHRELELANLQEPRAVLGVFIPGSKGVDFVSIRDLNRADSSVSHSCMKQRSCVAESCPAHSLLLCKT